jgi:predicted DNA-binding ribbon-helix-helix protein
MNSPVIKRSVMIAGHKTSVSLEDAFWKALKDIAITRQMTSSDLVTRIDAGREHVNLSSCLRLFVLDFYVNRSAIREPPSKKRSRNSRLQIPENQERLVAQRYR